MLERERQPARLRVDAQPGRLAVPVRERDVEHLHVHLADVAANPLLEHVDQETPVLLTRHRAAGHPLAFLHVQGPVAPRRPRHRPVVGGLHDPLDDRDELHEARAALVAEEPVHLAAVVGVGGMDRRQRVPVDSRVLQMREPLHHLVERALAALVHPVGVVQLPRPVDRDPDQDVVLLEERRPFLVQQCPVRLDRVDGPLPRLQIPLRELDRAAEELDPHQRRLTALPGDHHLRHPRVRLDQLPNICLQQLVRHPEPRARIQHLLRQEEAVGAVEIAHRTRRLRQQMKRRRRGGERVRVECRLTHGPRPILRVRSSGASPLQDDAGA